jgi:TolA-binding protein
MKSKTLQMTLAAALTVASGHAQLAPPPPPAPEAAPAPRAPKAGPATPGTPKPAPRQRLILPPDAVAIDLDDLKFDLEFDGFDTAEFKFQTDAARDAAREAARKSGKLARDLADLDSDRMKLDVEREVAKAMAKADIAGSVRGTIMGEVFRHKDFGLLAQAAPKPLPPIPPIGVDMKGRSPEAADRYYRRGVEYLDRREWDKAVESFDRVIQGGGTRADGAHYWKAYAQHRLGRRNEAQSTLADLNKNFPQSRWLGDAKVLEAEVRSASGKPVSPEAEADEDLKLYAINSLLHSEPERAIPLLEKILTRNNPPRLKERALFVLAQARTPKSNEIVASFARGKGNPDLQAKAVEYLGVYGGKENLQALSEIYTANNDPLVRRSILRGYLIAKDKERLLAAARSEQNMELRRRAVEYLGSLGAMNELADMYKGESNSDLRRAILGALSETENAERVIDIARSEKDPKLRMYAIRRLGDMNRTRTADALVSIYNSEQDRDVKATIIGALEDQNSARELVSIARSEKDAELKRAAVRRLSGMKSKEATDYLMELIDK